jgi:hypothetical protein
MRCAGPDIDGFARKSSFPPPNFAEPLVDAREVFHGLQESPIDLGLVPDFRVQRRYRAQSAMMIVKDNKVQVAPAHDCSVVSSREAARVEDSDSGETMLVERMRITSKLNSPRRRDELDGFPDPLHIDFSGWHLMKSLAVSKEYGLAR